MRSPAGRYQRLRAIASGGMATVYLGRAVGPGGFERFVAIKVMHPHLAADPEFVAAFLDEARLAARVRHPNVVSTLDVDAGDDGLFLVMDYVDGETLYAIHKRLAATKSRMPIPVALRVMIDALAGLHAAHELTSGEGKPLMLVHRDVSPQNIILGYDGIARIGDFGVARAESRLTAATHTGQVKGKYGYMSIEQLRAQNVDRRSDVYSAGVVLWELLAGERLFKGDNEATIALAAAAGVVQSPEDVNSDVPQSLDEVVMRALARAPDDRYPTALAFAEALEDAGDAAGIRPARAREVSDFLETMAEDAPTEVRPNALWELSRRMRARAKARGTPMPEDDTDRVVFDVADPDSVTDQLPPGTTLPDLDGKTAEPEPAPERADVDAAAAPDAATAAVETGTRPDPETVVTAPALPLSPEMRSALENAATLHDEVSDAGLRARAVNRSHTPLELHALTPSYPTGAAGTLVTTNYPEAPAPSSRKRAAIIGALVGATVGVVSMVWLVRSPAESEQDPLGTVTGTEASAMAAPASSALDAPPVDSVAPAMSATVAVAPGKSAAAAPASPPRPAAQPPAPRRKPTKPAPTATATAKAGGEPKPTPPAATFQPKLL